MTTTYSKTIYHVPRPYIMFEDNLSEDHISCSKTIYHFRRPYIMSQEHAYRVHRHDMGFGPQTQKTNNRK